MKIVFFEIEAWQKEYISQKLNSENVQADVSFVDSSMGESDISKISDSEVLAIFIHSKITSEILDTLPKVKMITTMSTGFDHIDIEECRKRKIIVCNVPTYGENTVAEHTFALLLSISRKIPQSYNKTSRGDFSLEGLRGFDLKGKTLGVVGSGNIGKNVILIGKYFGMNVIAFDVKQDAEFSEKTGFKYVSMEELLSSSDVITLHAPYNKYTHHMINKDNIKLIKKGAVLINTARGGLVETAALVESLDSGTISAAGLDVLEEEELLREEKHIFSEDFSPEKQKILLENHVLLQRDNVIVTPHNAFNSNEALQRIIDVTVANIIGFINNKMQNTVV